MEFDFLFPTSWPSKDIESKIAWGRVLEERGYSVALLLVTDELGSRRPDRLNGVFYMDDLVPEEVDVDLREVERRYSIPSIRHLFQTEKGYFRLTDEECVSRLRRLVSGMEALFSEHSFRWSLQERGGELHRLLVHYFIQDNGGTSIWHGFSPFEDSISLHTNLDGTWDTYRTIHYDDISESDRKETREYIEEFRERKRLIPKTSGDDARTSVTNRVLDTTRAFIDRKKPGSTWRQARGELRQKANTELNEFVLPSIEQSHRRVESNRYVFYPLQDPVESRLTVFAPQFYQQEYAIEYISRVLPHNVKLFVKPHPHYPGNHSPLWFRRILRNPGVELLHTSMHSHDIIEGAEAVVSINNTVGFETVIYGQPLLNLGNAFYSDLPTVNHLDDMSKLAEELAETVDREINEEEVISSVFSLRQASFQGSKWGYREGSANVIADGVEEFLAEIGEK